MYIFSAITIFSEKVKHVSESLVKAALPFLLSADLPQVGSGALELVSPRISPTYDTRGSKAIRGQQTINIYSDY